MSRAILFSVMIFFSVVYTSAQNIIHTYDFNLNKPGWDFAKFVKADQDGNIYFATGYNEKPDGSGEWGSAIGKFSASGSLLWQQYTPYAEVMGMDVSKKGNLYLTGVFKKEFRWGNVVLTDSIKRSIYTAKINSDGICQWARDFSPLQKNNTFNYYMVAYTDGLVLDKENESFYIYGNAADIQFDNYYLKDNSAQFFVKFNKDGITEFVHSIFTYPGWGGGRMAGAAINKDYVFITGYYCSDMFFTEDSSVVLKPGRTCTGIYGALYTHNGKLLWAKPLNIDNDEANVSAISMDDQGNIYLGGYYFNDALVDGIKCPTTVSPDVYLLKMDSLGNAFKLLTAGGNEQDELSGMVCTKSGLYCSIYCNSDSFKIADIVFNHTNKTHFFMQLDFNTLRPIWIRKVANFGSCPAPNIAQLSITGHNSISGIGDYCGSPVLDSITLPFKNTGDIFIFSFKTDENYSSVYTASASSNFSIFPNPGSCCFTIQSVQLMQVIRVRNILGNEVFYQKLQTPETNLQLDLSDKPKGVYFVEVENAGTRSIEKIVLQ